LLKLEMLKLFNHYVPSNTVLQVVIDAMLLFVAVIVAFVLQSKVNGALIATVVPSALAFAVTMMILNGALGLYRPGFGGGFRESLMRVVMSIALSIPVAYGIFQVLPWGSLPMRRWSSMWWRFSGLLSRRVVSLSGVWVQACW
jgi:FlaA1/EpsC-like NDP-sugar epimerase